MRKFHQKTRRGCRQCKSRHIKCDEARPSCRRCSRAELPCSFIGEIPAPRPWANEKPVSSLAKPNSPRPCARVHSVQLGPSLYTRRKLHNPPVRLEPQPSEHFGMQHFRLLWHFEHDIYEYTKEQYPAFNEAVPYFISQAMKTPYLMEQLLAYAAAHKSTVDPANRQQHLSESIKLQTRALATYNSTAPQVSDETCLSMFLYSSLLSHHIVFDVGCNMKDDLNAAIGWLTYSIGIHRGLIALAQTSWPRFSEKLQDIIVRTCKRDHNPVPTSGNTAAECQHLLVRLRASDLKSPALDHICAAVEALQDRFDAAQPDDSHSTWAVIQDWLVAIPAEFVDLLTQRMPEALVVLAYFSVLLHRAAEHWFVRDLGARLARVIRANLDPAWETWIEWPMSATGNMLRAPAVSYGLLF